MNLVLRVGAHRTASATFQAYLRANIKALASRGISFGCEKSDTSTMTECCVLAGDRFIDNTEDVLRKADLYQDIAERVSRYTEQADLEVTRIAISIRNYESFWSSLLALKTAETGILPTHATLERLAQNPRRWRDMISELALALPKAEIIVLPFESYAGLPERALAHMTDRDNLPRNHAREWLNRAPALEHLRKMIEERDEQTARLPEGTGRWQPFDRMQQSLLREAYADDLFWLRAGADGLAELKEDKLSVRVRGMRAADGALRGRNSNGIEDRRLA
ncbi:MAG: hypothetical protein AAF066_04615 [Pseudomonadota bacterium]